MKLNVAEIKAAAAKDHLSCFKYVSVSDTDYRYADIETNHCELVEENEKALSAGSMILYADKLVFDSHYSTSLRVCSRENDYLHLEKAFEVPIKSRYE
jgi:hypothetical protein